MKIIDIQKQLLEKNIYGQIVNRNIQFIAQDVQPEENTIFRLTGFSGSAGLLFITQTQTFLFVDGRYEIQAKKETSGVEVIFTTNCSFISWMMQNLPDRAKVAYNSWTTSIKEMNTYKRLLPHIDFVAYPLLTQTNPCTVFTHPTKYSGFSVEEKVSMLKLPAPMLICAADSVSWLTNLRSDALPHTPIIRAFALLGTDAKVELFADNTPSAKPLSDLETSLLGQQSVLLDEQKTPDEIKQILKKLGIWYQSIDDPIQDIKAVKNQTELEGFKNAHLKDGVALCKFLYWLENNWQGLRELDVVEKLQSFRQQNDGYFSDSFATIAASGKNAAIVHYSPTKESNVKLESLILLDSGAQYFEATTDVTRTIALEKKQTEAIKQKFTLVLKAHIALSSQIFPLGTNGVRLDAICRSELWKHKLDYAHGSGHGVGCFLSVHEGPQSMSPNGTTYPLQENMVISIEPGYYEEDNFGIRIENLAFVAKDSDFLKFVPLTLAPIDKLLINEYILDNDEINWLNDYHKSVFSKISPWLDEREKEWLKSACSPIES